MSKKEGIVVSVSGKYANLLTPYGEFIKVNCNGKKPGIGEKFQGNEIPKSLFYFNTKGLVAAACIMFILTIGGGVKAYYSPVATVLVDINPHIELKVNFLDKIISSKALNDDGTKILGEVKISNVNINDGLDIIIDQSKKDKFIDDNYMKTKTISVDINGKKIDISKFKSNIQASNLSVKIQSNGDVILNKDLNDKSNGIDNHKNPAGNDTLDNGNSSINKNDKKPASNTSSKDSNLGSVSNSKSDINKDKGNSDSKQKQASDINKNKESQITDSNKKSKSDNKPTKQNSNVNEHK